MRTLAELQAECARLGLTVQSNGRPNKQAWIAALRKHHWEQEYPGKPLPPQVQPMLLGDWQNLDDQTAREIEADQHEWIVQPKLDGVRALLHVEENSIRITGRCFSEVTYRLTEHQENLPHLSTGLATLSGTVFDGELTCPLDTLDTGSSVARNALQAAVAILATDPENAERIQCENNAWLQLHVFDILAYRGKDVSNLPLHDRLDCLAKALSKADNSHIHLVPSYAVNKSAIHHQILADGGEGTVWKRTDQPYETGMLTAVQNCGAGRPNLAALGK